MKTLKAGLDLIHPGDSAALTAWFCQFLFTVAVLCPEIAFSEGPFDGTWKTIIERAQLDTNLVTFSVSGGVYDNPSSVPKLHVKADGQDQPVSGKAYDTMAVKEIDGRTVQIITKKNGKIVAEQTRVASEDGKSMVYKTKTHRPGDGEMSTSELIYERRGEAPAEANATSGSWVLQKLSSSENDLLRTYRSSGDQLSCSEPAGTSWTAKLDGKDCPVKGDYSFDSVSLKQINERTIEETYKRHGKVIAVDTRSVSADGKTMTIVRDFAPEHRRITFVAEKQMRLAQSPFGWRIFAFLIAGIIGGCI